MATEYYLICPNCKSDGSVYLGQTRIECMRRDPEIFLGSCHACRKLFTTKERQCATCFKIEEKPLSFFNKLKAKFLKKESEKELLAFHDESSISTVICPKCKHKFLNARIIKFSD